MRHIVFRRVARARSDQRRDGLPQTASQNNASAPIHNAGTEAVPIADHDAIAFVLTLPTSAIERDSGSASSPAASLRTTGGALTTGSYGRPLARAWEVGCGRE